MDITKVILMGWISLGSVPIGGETGKNQQMLNGLRDCGVDVIPLDFYQWKKHPLVLLKTIYALLRHPRTPLILSTSPKNVYPLIKLHKKIGSRRKVIHWVVGGNMHKFLIIGEFDPQYLRSVDINIVETAEMRDTLLKYGVDNTLRLPNFKTVKYMPTLPPIMEGEKVRFVFISRVMPDKGVDYILDAMQRLNADGLSDRYEVDFYGPVGADYKDRFTSRVDSLPNARYCGFLDMTRPESYDTLAGYTAKLFPTYWVSEGFAGVIADVFIAGLPVIASRWSGNPDIIEEGVTGYIIEPHNVDQLIDRMRLFIDGKVPNLQSMRRRCQKEAMKYDTAHVINTDFLRLIGLLK